MDKIIKNIIGVLVITLLVFVPTGFSLTIYYLSYLINSNFSLDINGFFIGSLCGSMFMFVVLMWLLISKKLRFDEDAENTEQEN